MKIDNEDKINMLTIHKENLLKCTNFEEYRNAHVAYIDMFIGQISAEQKWVNATVKFVKDTE